MSKLRALIVEDSKNDAALLVRHLTKAGYDVESTIVKTSQAMTAALEHDDWDVILADYSMPQFTGIEALSVARESGGDLPFIIISGTIGDESAVEAMRLGANDYLLKGELGRLSAAIQRELENAANRRAGRRIAESLRQSEARLANAQRIAHLGNWVWDIQRDHLHWSAETSRIFGLGPGPLEANYASFLNGTHPDDRTLVQNAVDAAIAGTAPYDFEHRLLRPNGEERIVWEIGEVTYDEKGQPLAFTGTVQDITDRKRAEHEKSLLAAKIGSQHRRINNIIANVPGVVWEAWGKPDAPNQRINFVSDYVEQMLGYTVEEWLATPNFWLTIVHPDDKEEAAKHASQTFASGKTGTNNFRWLAKDGRVVWIEAHSVSVTDDTGQPVAMRGVNLDITVRKQNEQLARESEERFRNIVETANEGIWLIDLKSHTTYVNEQMAQMLGHTVEEMLGRPVLDFVFDEDQGAMQAKLALRTRETSGTNEFRLRCKDGSEVIMLYNGSPMIDQSGKLAGFLSMNTDITERKKADRLLQETEARYRNLVELSPAVVYLAEPLPPFSTIYISPNISQFGYTVAEWIDQSDRWLSVIHDEDRARIVQSAGEALSEARETDLDYRIVAKNGTLHWVNDKGHFVFDETGEPTGWQGIILDVTKRKQAELEMVQLNRELDGQRLRLKNIVSSVPGIVWESWGMPDSANQYVDFVSDYVLTMVGYSVEEWLATPEFWLSIIHPDDRERVVRQAVEQFSSSEPGILEFRMVAKDGRIFWVESISTQILDKVGRPAGRRGVTMDITERKRSDAALHESERHLLQAQKLESVGLLAGGIAHDFNNMLTVINGYSELALRRLDPEDPIRRDLEEIRSAGKRSAELTYQLLAFSRQQVLQPIVLDLNDMIADTIKMLQRLIGEDIMLTTTLDPKVAAVLVDPGQLTQIVMNLAVNSRDAMTTGGKLTIETSNSFLDEEYARLHPGVTPGPYVLLAVSDTGIGMPPEATQHIFEPFYTTKPVGEGTGLGLATVYGIVKQSGGNIEVYSELGVGTTFKIYLPQAVTSAEEVEASRTFIEMPRGTETILLVEDEESVRNLALEILESCGYRVVAASNGAQALRVCDPACPIDLLMTDVVMPIMGGRELAEKLLVTRPDLRILFTSGYTDDAVVRHGVSGNNTNFLHKPFTVGALAYKVREILDGKSESGVFGLVE
jgi:PAS domain S-box-containing protein